MIRCGVRVNQKPIIPVCDLIDTEDLSLETIEIIFDHDAVELKVIQVQQRNSTCTGFVRNHEIIIKEIQYLIRIGQIDDPYDAQQTGVLFKKEDPAYLLIFCPGIMV